MRVFLDIRTVRRSWSRLAVCLATLAAATPVAVGEVNLEWRPESQTVCQSETVEIGLYAVSTTGQDQAVAAVDVILNWDPATLELVEVVDDGPYQWLFSGFPDDAGLDGLNDTWEDGDAYYQALGQFGSPAYATPDGLRITTFRFVWLAPTADTAVTIPESAGDYTETAVWDGKIPGLNIVGERGTATVTILDCQIVQAESCLPHDAAGEFCLALPDGGIEPRLPRIAKLVITLNGPAADSPGVSIFDGDGAAVGGVSAVAGPGEDQVTVLIAPPLANLEYYQVVLDGVGNDWHVMNVEGDVDRSGVVTSVDASSIKPRYGQATTADNFVYDVTCDGIISSVDGSGVKPRFGDAAPECP